MKIRTDFVTNSSSSSFIIARKPTLNEKQKDAIIKFVEKKLLGEEILSPDSSDEEIKKAVEEDGEVEEYEEEIRKALSEGKTIYEGWVSFDECEYTVGNIFERLWEILEDVSDGDFVAIDGELSY